MLVKKRFQWWILKLKNLVEIYLKPAMKQNNVQKIRLLNLINDIQQVFPMVTEII